MASQPALPTPIDAVEIPSKQSEVHSYSVVAAASRVR